MKFHILLDLAPAFSHTTNRPDIKENTAPVVAACQNNILFLWRVLSMKLNIATKIAGLEIMTLNRVKNVLCLQTYKTNV